MPTKSPTPTVKPAAARQPHVLVVDDEPGLRDVLADACRGLGCRVTAVATMQAARRKLATGTSVELLVVDVNLPDGDGTALLPTLRKHHPTASAIVVTGDPSVARAVAALRGGAADFLPKPFDPAHLTDRVRAALAAQRDRSRQEKRLARLRGAVKRLGVARRMVNQKVDVLCNDLIGAYGDLAKQVETVRTEEHFRKQIAPAADLEQLLCHTMDWVLKQLGPANVGVCLAGDDGDAQLAAYMKHTVAGEDAFTDALRLHVLPAVTRDDALHAPGADLAGTRDDLIALHGHDLVGQTVSYLGEPLAVILAFRELGTAGFDDGHAAALKAVAPVLATALAAAVRGDPADESATPDDDGESRAAADCWKRGDAPPF